MAITKNLLYPKKAPRLHLLTESEPFRGIIRLIVRTITFEEISMDLDFYQTSEDSISI